MTDPATFADMAKKKRGRPPLDPEGTVELRLRVTQAQAEKAERVARARGFVDIEERPIIAAAVRAMIDEHPEPQPEARPR